MVGDVKGGLALYTRRTKDKIGDNRELLEQIDWKLTELLAYQRMISPHHKHRLAGFKNCRDAFHLFEVSDSKRPCLQCAPTNQSPQTKQHDKKGKKA